MNDGSFPYVPRLSEAEAERIRAWHDRAYAELRSRGTVEVQYLGRAFVVPADVFGPTPTSHLLGERVLAEVRPTDRVLDMGTGCGVNAILAASASTDVVGVDLNPAAVAAAEENAARNGVADRTVFRVSDVFDAVHGTYDLVVFDPPFRWFKPHDLLEASIADENYRALRRFATEAGTYLRPNGRVLLFFGTSGDFAFLTDLLTRTGWTFETAATCDVTIDDHTVTYGTLRLTR